MPGVVRQRGEGKAYWFLGELYDVRVSGEDSGGQVAVVEITIPAGEAFGMPFGAPPHVHLDADETAYVLEGSARYHLGDQVVEAGAGAAFHFPKGTFEWFENSGSGPLKVLLQYSPAGIERFFAEAGQPATTRTIPPAPTSPPDLPALVALAKKHNLEIRLPGA